MQYLHAAQNERLIKQLQYVRDQYNCIYFILKFTCLIRNFLLNMSGNFYISSRFVMNSFLNSYSIQ